MNNQVSDSLIYAAMTLPEDAPEDLELVLQELGAGDNRFGGTSYGRGECDLRTFLLECRNAENPAKIPASLVPQSTYWLVDDGNRVIGMVRVRLRLNERLLQYGGHIGYYVRESHRGKGHGKQALRLGLAQLRGLGVSRALLTVNPANTPSKLVVMANGGVPDGQGVDPVSGETVDQFWIEL
jgi:predicted acetyltransferase